MLPLLHPMWAVKHFFDWAVRHLLQVFEELLNFLEWACTGSFVSIEKDEVQPAFFFGWKDRALSHWLHKAKDELHSFTKIHFVALCLVFDIDNKRSTLEGVSLSDVLEGVASKFSIRPTLDSSEGDWFEMFHH